MIHVYLVDDHNLVRQGVSRMIDSEPDMKVVGQSHSGWRFLQDLAEPSLTVDVLILDLSMPALHGTEVLRRALALRPELAVLVLSMYAEQEYGAALVAEGAAGYLCKDQTDLELGMAVRTVASGRTYLSRSAMRQRGPQLPHQSLTPRELQVFLLLLEGRQPSDIAAELDLGVSTVSTHIGHIRTKLGARSIGEIVHYAHRHGLVD